MTHWIALPMEISLKWTSVLVTILFTIGLTACGGGGGNSSADNSVRSVYIGDVTIQNIEDVAILEGVTAIEGYLYIHDITFEAFNFLSNITEIDGALVIEHNTSIKRLSDLGINNLQSVSELIYIRLNDS